jgi:hypothetical protein
MKKVVYIKPMKLQMLLSDDNYVWLDGCSFTAREEGTSQCITGYKLLHLLADMMDSGGRLVLEVPNEEDKK